MLNFDLLFIVTCTSEVHIHNLLNSIVLYNKDVYLKIVLLLQNNLRIDVHNYKRKNIDIVLLYSKKQVSLSCARNMIIQYILCNQLKFDYVMFPDDDSVFDAAFFLSFKNKVRGDSLIDVYCLGTRKLYKLSRYRNNSILKAKNYEAAMSVNVCVSYKTFQGVVFFDEQLGVGAKYGAGEDSDYFIRCCLYNKRGFVYIKDLWNYHPAASLKYNAMTYSQLKMRYKTYGEGVVYMLYKHKMINAIYQCIARGILGGIVALLHFDLKLCRVRFYAVGVRLKTYVSLLK